MKKTKIEDTKKSVSLPKIMTGGSNTNKIDGIHLLTPTQKQINQAKKLALEKGLDKIFIYHNVFIYTGINGQGYTYNETTNKYSQGVICE